jgi:hypothetical protein
LDVNFRAAMRAEFWPLKGNNTTRFASAEKQFSAIPTEENFHKSHN